MPQTTYGFDPVAGYEGALYDVASLEGVASFTNQEAAAVAPGLAVSYDPATDGGVLLPDAASDVIAGVAVLKHVSPDELDAAGDGYPEDTEMPVLRRGRVWAVCVDGCVPGNPLFVSTTVGGGGEGALRATTATGAIDLTAKGTWESTAAALGLAILNLNL